MKKLLMFVLLLTINFGLCPSNDPFKSCDGPYSKPPYNNREIQESLHCSSSESRRKTENLTFAQQQVREFMNKKDTFNQNNNK